MEIDGSEGDGTPLAAIPGHTLRRGWNQLGLSQPDLGASVFVHDGIDHAPEAPPPIATRHDPYVRPYGVDPIPDIEASLCRLFRQVHGP